MDGVACAQSKRTRTVSLRTLPIDPPLDGVQRISLTGELGGDGELVLDRNAYQKPDRFGDFQSDRSVAAPPAAVRFQQIDLADETGRRRKVYEVIGQLSPPGARYYLVSPSRKTGAYRLVVDQSAVNRRVFALESFPPPAVPAERVQEIVKVEAVVLKTDPPTLLVTATGQVAPQGWKEPHLSRRVYVEPPEDGIWEYDLLAVPPKTGTAAAGTDAKKPKLQARNRWRGFDASKVKGVRVFGIGDGVRTLMIEPAR